MKITVYDDNNSIISQGVAYTNFALLHGKLGEIKRNPAGTMYFSSLALSNGKDKDGNWRPSTFCELSAKEWTAVKGDTVTVRCQYEVRDWTKTDGTKVKFHQFRVWEVLSETAPAAYQSRRTPAGNRSSTPSDAPA